MTVAAHYNTPAWFRLVGYAYKARLQVVRSSDCACGACNSRYPAVVIYASIFGGFRDATTAPRHLRCPNCVECGSCMCISKFLIVRSRGRAWVCCSNH